MLDERINALPIVNFKHELAGIITMSDILKYVMNLQ
jgi:CBS domain-containing protein